MALQPHAIASLFVGLGALHAMTLASSFISTNPRAPSPLSTLACTAAAVSIVIARITSGWAICDQSDNYTLVQHGHAYLDYFPLGALELLRACAGCYVTMCAGAVVLGRGDMISVSIRYLQVRRTHTVPHNEHHE